MVSNLRGIQMLIRHTKESELVQLLAVQRAAFGDESVETLVNDIFNDATAMPGLSMMSYEGLDPLGHILFSKVSLEAPDMGLEQDNAPEVTEVPGVVMPEVVSLSVVENTQIDENVIADDGESDEISVSPHSVPFHSEPFQGEESNGAISSMSAEPANSELWIDSEVPVARKITTSSEMPVENEFSVVSELTVVSEMPIETISPVIDEMLVEQEQPVDAAVFEKDERHQEMRRAQLTAVLLSPIGVLPEEQGRGVGRKMIEVAIKELNKMRIDLVFVLGDPSYFARYGFRSAESLGFEPPFKITETNTASFMVKGLRTGVIGDFRAKVKCCDTLNQPGFWGG